MSHLARKTSILTCRITPEMKERLVRAAEVEHRSLASMLEVMVLDWCKRHGISSKGANGDGETPVRGRRESATNRRKTAAV